MAKDIKFDIEARDGLKRGVDALANAKVTSDQKVVIIIAMDQTLLKMVLPVAKEMNSDPKHGCSNGKEVASKTND
jgi:chaperonin GroEL